MAKNTVCFPVWSFFACTFLAVLSIIATILLFARQAKNLLELIKQVSLSSAKVFKESLVPNQIIEIARVGNPVNSRNEIKYPEGKYTRSDNMDFGNFRNSGYIYNGNSKFPLFSNVVNRKYYYYTQDDSRNGIRIPLTKRNFQEIYDGDTVQVPEMGGDLQIKMYNNEENRYLPIF